MKKFQNCMKAWLNAGAEMGDFCSTEFDLCNFKGCY
jgi:hypothetical protein